MALEYKLSYTASEIDKKLTDIDEISASLALKADIIDGKIPLEQLPDDIGSGGSITSWNDLTDKPFGESKSSITWDGTPTGEFGHIEDLEFYKVSDTYIDAENLTGSVVSLFIIEESADLTEIVSSDSITEFGENVFGISSPNLDGIPPIIITSSATVIEEIEFPSAGIWFLSIPDVCYTRCLESVQIKQIDKKYIPNDIGGGVTSWNDLTDKPFGEFDWSIEWDGTPTDEFFDVTDTMGAILYKVGESKTKEELIGATCKYNTFEPVETIEYTIASSDIMDTDSENCFVIFHNGIDGIAVSVLIDGSYNFMGINFTLTKGIWFVKSSNYTPIYLGGKEIKQIAPKFIPNYFGEIGFYTDCDISNATATVSVPVNEDEFGMSEFRFFKFSEPIDDSIKGYLLSVLIDGENMEIPMGDEDRDAPLIVSDTGSEYTLYALNIKTNNEIVNMEDFGLPIFTVAEAGLYVLDVSLLGGQVNYFKSPDYNMIKIDKKFIPDDITAAVSITYDEFPIEGSQNPVKSAGIHSAISALESKVTSAFCYKGTVKNYTDLPIEGNSIGDVWNIANADEINEVEAGDNAAWDGESWDILAGVVDLSNYYTKEEINTLIGNCDTVINSINTLIGGG